VTETGPHFTPIPGSKRYKRVGDYEILSKLGQGAMGSVYLAKQQPTGRLVALKILPPDLARDQELLERFRREARASQRISHPNIVNAVDFGTVDKYHYIAMDYVDGPDLESMLKKSGKFQADMLLRVASEMCSALEEIEKHGIVHRDVKPSNILMTSKGSFRLTDLGLATASQGDQRLTLAGFAVGTPYYLSPEQARGQLDVDIRADIYGLGATLYHLATGAVPFPGSNPVMVMTQHISKALRPPHETEPNLPMHVSALIQHLMEKDEKKRPQNCAELRKCVECCARGEIPGKPVQRITPKARDAAAGKAKTQKLAATDRLQRILNVVYSFLPPNLRMPAAIVTLALGCVLLLAILLVLVLAK
jgi:serine/threonine-protein kinase